MRRAQQARTRYRQCESRFEIGLRTVVLRGHALLALSCPLSLALSRSLSFSVKLRRGQRSSTRMSEDANGCSCVRGGGMRQM